MEKSTSVTKDSSDVLFLVLGADDARGCVIFHGVGGWEVGGIKGEGKGADGHGGTMILKKIGSIKCGGGLSL